MAKQREEIIVKVGILGIIANVFLSAIKFVIGLFVSSISIMLDAVNNLTDAISSIVTIIGIKLSGKKPDKKHPLGYGRIEYLSTVAVAAVILYAGITSAVESIKKIINPEEPHYNLTSLIVIAIAVLVKIFLGLYTQKKGKENKSDALVASGKDALFDAVISSSVLVAALLNFIFHLNLESYLGVIISLFIIKSGFEMLHESLDEILGLRLDSETSKAIKETICSFDEVNGAYDLVVHNYGPEYFVGSVHIEVDDNLSVRKLDKLEREITETVMRKHNVIMTGISIYVMNSSDEVINGIKQKIVDILSEYKSCLEMHGFYVDNIEKQIRFDIVIDFNDKERTQIYESVIKRVQDAYPLYTLNVILDADISG